MCILSPQAVSWASIFNTTPLQFSWTVCTNVLRVSMGFGRVVHEFDLRPHMCSRVCCFALYLKNMSIRTTLPTSFISSILCCPDFTQQEILLHFINPPERIQRHLIIATRFSFHFLSRFFSLLLSHWKASWGVSLSLCPFHFHYI